MTLHDAYVTLAHGGGGRAMRNLIEDVFVRVFEPPGMEDQARLSHAAFAEPGARLAFTTDSFVVTPIEFPGGNIGHLAVCGTVNDLAVGGAKPLWLSASFIIEEGTEVALLRRIVAAMAQEATKANVRIVTGDTKIVERKAADGVFVTTSGIGVIAPGVMLCAESIEPGDDIIVSGTIGDHGAAILSARADLGLSGNLVSDCAGLGHMMAETIAAAPATRAARDCTRGGLASALNEMAMAAGVGLRIDENYVPIRREVRGLCELLGLDPLYLANEGMLVLFAPKEQSQAALSAMRKHEQGRHACIVGQAIAEHPGEVRMITAFGGARLIDMLVGEQLPRIC